MLNSEGARFPAWSRKTAGFLVAAYGSTLRPVVEWVADGENIITNDDLGQQFGTLVLSAAASGPALAPFERSKAQCLLATDSGCRSLRAARLSHGTRAVGGTGASIQQKQRSTPTSRQPLDKHCVAVAAKRDSSDPMDVDSIWKYCGKKCGQKEGDHKARIMATASAARKAQQVRVTVPVPVRIC